MFWCYRCYALSAHPSGPCRACGEPVEAPAELSYVDGLIWALRHPDGDRAIVAARTLSALLDAGITVFFVTHRFAFAERFHRQYARSTLFLRAERQPDGRRSYKLAVKDPLPTSYGEDLYYQLGGWLNEDRALAPPAGSSKREA